MSNMTAEEKQQAEEKIVMDFYNKKRKKKIKRVIAVAIGLLLAFAVFRFFFTVGKIPTSSMTPTLPVGTYVLIDNRAYKNANPVRGDIICFYMNGALVTKRVIGVPGDRIKICDGNVYVNGALLNEIYLSEETINQGTYGNIDVTVPNGSYYLLGDNRNNSNDSRYWTEPCISKKAIVGRIFANFSIKDHYYREIEQYVMEEEAD